MVGITAPRMNVNKLLSFCNSLSDPLNASFPLCRGVDCQVFEMLWKCLLPSEVSLFKAQQILGCLVPV